MKTGTLLFSENQMTLSMIDLGRMEGMREYQTGQQDRQDLSFPRSGMGKIDPNTRTLLQLHWILVQALVLLDLIIGYPV
jgi:hypothetical protein